MPSENRSDLGLTQDTMSLKRACDLLTTAGKELRAAGALDLADRLDTLWENAASRYYSSLLEQGRPIRDIPHLEQRKEPR